YMGIVVQYNDRHEAIPVVSNTEGLEYDLTTLIRKLGRERSQKLAFITGHEGPSLAEDLSRAQGALSELFEVQEVDLRSQELPDDAQAALVVGPKSAFSEAEKRKLDRFVVAGHAAAFFLGPIKPNLTNLEQEPNDPQLADLLGHYGVDVQEGLVLDAECATISVAQQAGFMRINQPVRYPYMPMPRALEDNNLTRALSQVAFPFMAPVQPKTQLPPGVQATTLARSSPNSWVQHSPFDLSPTQRWEPPHDGGDMRAQGLIVSLEGALPSFYGAASEATPAAPARLLVAGGASFIQDPFFGKANETLLMNFADWLVRDDALLAVRSRGLAAAPLAELSDAKRSAVKFG
ncbi:MAG: ABC transporter permease, partial [Deltaproteobacteria bacterium]